MFDAGPPIAIRAGNPTKLVAPFVVDRSAQTEAGLVLFAIDSGTPQVDYQPWGFGDWGDGEAWGEWEPKMLQLRSATGDIVTIDPTDYLDPLKASFAMRIVRHTDTGTPELFLECGEDGEDWLRLYVDSDDTLMLWWSSGGALPQTVSSTEAIEPSRVYLVACEWQHTFMALRVDRSEKVEGLRDVPTGAWGAGLLQLKAA